MKTPCIRPRISSGAASCSIDVRRTALTMSPAPATARHSTASQSDGRQPEPDDRHAPDHDRAEHDRALPVDPRRPSPRSGPSTSAPIEMPANSQPRLFGRLGEPGLRQLREHRLRPGEHHRDDVDDEGHQQHRLGAQEREALADPADGGTDAAAGRRRRPAAATAARAAAARRRGSRARRPRRRGTARPGRSARRPAAARR